VQQSFHFDRMQAMLLNAFVDFAESDIAVEDVAHVLPSKDSAEPCQRYHAASLKLFLLQYLLSEQKKERYDLEISLEMLIDYIFLERIHLLWLS